MENRYREGLRNIIKKARIAEKVFAVDAERAEDENSAILMRSMAMAYKIVVGWVIDEIRDADDEVRNGGENND